jgi:hypothetical protein
VTSCTPSRLAATVRALHHHATPSADIERPSVVDLGGKEGRKGKELGSSAEATVYELSQSRSRIPLSLR